MQSIMDWNPDAIARLRVLWAENLSTAEIGRRFGTTKNAIIGKAHRLKLPSRPSPVRSTCGKSDRKRVRRPATAPAAAIGLALLRTGMTERVVAPAPSSPRPIRIGTTSCCWPLGEPGAPGFRFCTELAIAGRPYCPEHCDLAYVRKPARQERDERQGNHKRPA